MKPHDPAAPSKQAMDELALPPTAPAPVAPRAAAAPHHPPAAPAAPAATERALVARAAGGDEEAFAMLVEQHKDRAYALALRMTRSREDAQDVAQEAFVRAWLALPRFRGESSFGTWLHRIVARRALDRSIALQARRRREADLEVVGEVPVPASTHDPGLARRLDRLVEELSPAQRAAVTLYYREDRSVEEIAAALEMPENTVKTHLSRARASLREAWLREEGGR